LITGHQNPISFANGAVQKSLMPKGVDHNLVHGVGHLVPNVQKSLMPKGVDHDKTRHLYPNPVSAKIFDAERR